MLIVSKLPMDTRADIVTVESSHSPPLCTTPGRSRHCSLPPLVLTQVEISSCSLFDAGESYVEYVDSVRSSDCHCPYM